MRAEPGKESRTEVMQDILSHIKQFKIIIRVMGATEGLIKEVT